MADLLTAVRIFRINSRIKAECYCFESAVVFIGSLSVHDLKSFHSFLPAVPDDGLEGWLLYANPADACHKLERPPSSPVNRKPWIVMARRFNCTFEEKAIHAEAAGWCLK